MDVALLCRSSSDGVQPLTSSPGARSESEDDQNYNTKRNDIGPLPPIREACAGIGFQQQPLTSKSTDFVVLPPLTPTPLNGRTIDDTPNLSESVTTCTLLCQEIEQLRRGWSTWSMQDREGGLEQLSKSANGLLYMLTRQVSESSPMDEDEPSKATPITSITTQSSASASNTASKPPTTDPLSASPEYIMIRRARNLQDAVGIRQSYRRRAKKATAGQRCHSCHTAETPEWRRGPDGARTLCNACGLHYSKLVRRGSLTVQRGYAIGPGGDSGRPSVSPRIIEYPVRDEATAQLQTSRVGVGMANSDTSFINYVSPPVCNESRPRDHPP